jgi:NAD(P)-dependent dehydrogenase (short-subunit alcohol dehydrogenase family)
MKLKDRVAIVTGGGRGLGREMALAFAEEGANLVLVARTQSEIETVAQEVRALGRRALAVPTDVSVEEQVNRMAQRTADEFGRIDILVNNAGGPFGTMNVLLRDLSLADWQLVMNINVNGTFLCSRAVLKYMMAQRSGVIINITSGHGSRGRAGRIAYCTAKFGQEGLTQSMAMELAPFNIRVNALKPGGQTATPAVFMEHPDAPVDQMQKPEIIRQVAVYLASDDSTGVTGQSLDAKVWREDQGDINKTLERMSKIS